MNDEVYQLFAVVVVIIGSYEFQKKHVFEHDHHRRWTGSAHYYQM